MSRLRPWPPLPDPVRELLEQPPDEPFPDTPRPWALCSLPPPVEDAVWLWLDQVAQWLNWTYGWGDEQVIPACWHQHEGIYSATTAAYIGRWHDDMEHFHRRMTTTLGPNFPRATQPRQPTGP